MKKKLNNIFDFDFCELNKHSVQQQITNTFTLRRNDMEKGVKSIKIKQSLEPE